MSLIHEAVVSLLIVMGGSFALIGSWGMVKLPDLITRLHAPTKATTLGVGGALVASMLYFLASRGAPSVHEVLISLFLFLSAPISGSFLAKAYLHGHLDPVRDLPPTGRERGWSTYDEAPPGDGGAKGEDEDQHGGGDEGESGGDSAGHAPPP